MTGKRPKWEGKSKRVTREHLRGVTRYPVLPGPQNRLCVWWNGRYSAFSKVDVPAATKPLLPFFSLNEGTLVCFYRTMLLLQYTLYTMWTLHDSFLTHFLGCLDTVGAEFPRDSPDPPISAGQ